MLDGPSTWEADPTLKRAIEIQDGHILNADLLVFQDRSPDYPHRVSRDG